MPTTRKIHVAIAMKSGKPVAVALNNYERSRTLGKYYRSEHAEVALIRQLTSIPKNRRLPAPRYNLVVYRMLPDGQFGESKPCKWCQQRIHESGLFNKVYFSTESTTGDGLNLPSPSSLGKP